MVTNVLAIIAILVTVSGVAWYKTIKEAQHEAQRPQAVLVQNQKAPPPHEPTGEASTTSTTLLTGPNAISVASQKPGISIKVGAVTMEKAGFIAIHEVSAGKPGKIIAFSKLLPPGMAFDFEIMLGRETIEVEKFIAMLHTDDGNGKFDAMRDKPVKDRDGNAILARFEISGNAGAEPEEAGNIIQ